MMASGLWEEMSLGWITKRKHGLVYFLFSRRLMQAFSLLLGRSVDNARLMCRSLGLSSFKTVDMNHGCRCYGAVITHEDGWRIAQVYFSVFFYVVFTNMCFFCRFSGDTRPTQNLVDAGSKATVLIHEATMADEELELAQTKGHSTVRQAIDVGKRFVIFYPLLTHLLTFFHSFKKKHVSPAYLAHPFLSKILQDACY